ncbi:MFS transporter [Galbitalea sp. SE-J8]|uniref:MFS transporter n=1 Tax=Galbitalea sp. SE-J8 TaxID=3054952 RepID=UPI00259CEB92|nr:MFS transporter [Galbitalea sp. SE-J8]MDM4761968.1 MFS transporter [Galbitalea sp. SE-J8]
MLRSYLDVLRVPRVLRVFLPAQLAKLSFCMITLAILLAVHGATGSFAAAGLATGAFGVANVVVAPARARFIDRRGQRVALTTISGAFAAASVGLAIVTWLPDPPVTVIAGIAVLLGVSCPPVGAAMRVLWGDLVRDPIVLRRAYSLDTVLEELLFTAGPLVVSGVVALSAPPAGLVATGCAALIGTVLMTRAPASRARAAVLEPAPPHDSPLRQHGFVPTLVALLGGGLVIGAVEVAVPAAAADAPPLVVGVLFAMMPVGSGLGGLAYGAIGWRSRAATRLVLASAGLAAACGLLVAAPGLVVLGAMLVGVGLFIAPSMITGYTLVDELTPPSTRTEAFAWVGTATNLGAAAASAVGGWLVDHVSVPASFGFGAVTAAVCILVATPFLRRARPRQALGR